MDTYILTDFKGGWVVGDFIPSVLSTKAFEVAIKRYDQWEREDKHVHKIADEVTIIVEGSVLMNGRVLGKNSVIHLKAGEAVDFFTLTPVTTCVIKTPSIVGDKYPVEK